MDEDEDEIARLLKAYRDEVDYCWTADIAVPAHVVMSRERLTVFVRSGIEWLIQSEKTLLEKKLTAMRNERRRHLH